MQSARSLTSLASTVSLNEFGIKPVALEPSPEPVEPVLSVVRQNRQAPLIVRFNRLLRTSLVTLCGLVLLGYGLDVAATHDVSKMQEQAQRLNEQNSELSAQLLKAISFQGIQANVLGRSGLRVPEHVLITKELKPAALKVFKPSKHYLPLMSGY